MVVRHCRPSPSPQTTPHDEFLSMPVPISVVLLGNRPQEHARHQSQSTLYAPNSEHGCAAHGAYGLEVFRRQSHGSTGCGTYCVRGEGSGHRWTHYFRKLENCSRTCANLVMQLDMIVGAVV